MSALLFNPSDTLLKLADKDRKLYQEVCKGLKEEDCFDAKRENYSNFVKTIEQQLQDVRVMEILEIPTVWGLPATNPNGRRLPVQTNVVDIFRSQKATNEQVTHYCDLVWARSAHVNNTPEYFARFENTPVDTDSLNLLRNTQKLKHIILGKNLWNSLMLSFQIKI